MSVNPTVTDNEVRYPSLAALKIANNELLNQRNANGEDEDFLRRVTVFLTTAQATGAILNLENERWTCQSILDYWSNFLDRHENVDLVAETLLAPVNDKLIPDIPESKRPYVGLDAFRESKQEWFFGREKVVDELIEKLADQPCLFIVGPSGSGKSSVVLAGLLPKLKAGAINRSNEWQFFPPIVPGFDPLASLVSLVEPPGTRPENWVRQEALKFRQDRNHLLELVNARKFEPALIVVDQFEEIFTLTSDENIRRAFIENLLTLIDYPDLRHTVIFTMRSDIEPNVERIPELYQKLKLSHFRVTPLSAVEVQEAIQKPADLVGLRFEEGIVDELVKETVAESNGLPLLQFTLLKLWNSRKNNLVTWEAFKKLGSCREALTRSADNFYNSQSPADQLRVKSILLSLVRPGAEFEVFSKRIARSDLYGAPEERDHVDQVLNGLIKEDLVRETEGTTPGDLKVEVAHETLVRHWQRFVAWLDEERVSLRKRANLTEAARQWDESGRDSGALLRGSLLAEALRFEQLNPVEDAFVKASLSRQKRGSQLVILLAVAAVVVAVGIAVFYKVTAKAAEVQATKALARELAAKALMNKNDLSVALLLAVQAYKTYDTPEGRTSLASLLSQSSTRKVVSYLRRPQQPIRALSLVDDTTLRGITSDGTLYTWNLKAPQEAPKAVSTGVSRVAAVALAGPVCAVSTLDGDIVVADSSNGTTKQPFKVEGHADEVALSADGKIVAASGYLTENIHVWDVQSGELLVEISPNNPKNPFGDEDVSALTLSKDGKFLVYVVGAFGDEVRLYDVAKKSVVRTFKAQSTDWFEDTYYSAALSDDQTILAASSDNGLTLWETKSGKQLAKLAQQKSQEVRPLFFAPDNTLVLATEDGKIAMHKATDWSELGKFDSFESPTSFIETLSGELLAVAALGGEKTNLFAASTRRGEVIVWDLNADYSLGDKLFAAREKTALLAISPDGTRLAYAGVRIQENPTVVVVDWNNVTQTQTFTATPPRDNSNSERIAERFVISDLTFAPDGTLVAFVYGLTTVATPATGSIFIWVLRTGEYFKPPIDKNETPRRVVLSPDGKTAAFILMKKATDSSPGPGKAASTPAKLAIWRFGSGEPLKTLSETIEMPAAISFSSDGKLLASIDNTYRLTIWDLQSGTESAGKRLSTAQQTSFSDPFQRPSLAFSPDGKTLAITIGGSRLIFYDVTKKDILSEHNTLEYRAATIVFSRDSKKMALTGAETGTALWDVEARREIGTLGADIFGQPVFSPSGQALVHSTGNEIHSVNINIESWTKRACAIANRDLDENEWKRLVGDVPYQKTCGLY